MNKPPLICTLLENNYEMLAVNKSLPPILVRSFTQVVQAWTPLRQSQSSPWAFPQPQLPQPPRLGIPPRAAQKLLVESTLEPFFAPVRAAKSPGTGESSTDVLVDVPVTFPGNRTWFPALDFGAVDEKHGVATRAEVGDAESAGVVFGT